VFFVVGHIAVKMLVYFDDQEEMIKRVVMTKGNKEAVDEMENICGGSEAEIDELVGYLSQTREQNFVQKGILGLYLPLLLSVAKSAAALNSPSLLHRSAILALCKVMCVSSQLC
jgi:hypothetical protein